MAALDSSLEAVALSKDVNERLNAAKRVRRHLDQERRVRSADSFQVVLSTITDKLEKWANSPSARESLGCALLIAELLTLRGSVKTHQFFVNLLQMIIGQQATGRLIADSPKVAALETAAHMLGRIASGPATSTSVIVEYEILRALEWLKERNPSEMKRYAAVLVLKVLAVNSPTLFNVHSEKFFVCIAKTLRDSKARIRIASAVALRHALRVVAQRESLQKNSIYRDVIKLSEEAFESEALAPSRKVPLKRRLSATALSLSGRGQSHSVGSSTDSYSSYQGETGPRNLSSAQSLSLLHGALLVLYELLGESTGKFIQNRFNEIHLKFLWRQEVRYHSNPQIREAVMMILPRLAFHCPDISEFKSFYKRAMEHLIEEAQGGGTRGPAFIALGQMCALNPEEFHVHVPKVIELIKAAFQDPFCHQALDCLSTILKEAGHVELDATMIPLLFNGGFNETLISTLNTLARTQHLPRIQLRLTQELTRILAVSAVRGGKKNRNFQQAEQVKQFRTASRKLMQPSSGESATSPQSANSSASSSFRDSLKKASSWVAGIGRSENSSTVSGITGNLATVAMASSLEDEQQHQYDNKDPSPATQVLALRTLATFDLTGIELMPLVCSLVLRHLDSPDSHVRLEAARACSSVLGRQKCEDETFNHVLQRLLMTAIIDEDVALRGAVIQDLATRFPTPLLKNAHATRTIVTLTNDRAFYVRAMAVEAVAKLATLNAPYIMPSLTKLLVRLLNELNFCADSNQREESVVLLGVLVRSVGPGLARPHITPIISSLLEKIDSEHKGVATAMLATLGEVACVGDEATLSPMLNKVLPIIVEILDDKSASSDEKRTVALHTLATLSSNAALPVWPYLRYPNLLDHILQIIVQPGGSWDMRRQAMVTFGMLGALDPWLYRNQQALGQTLLRSLPNWQNMRQATSPNSNTSIGIEDTEAILSASEDDESMDEYSDEGEAEDGTDTHPLIIPATSHPGLWGGDTERRTSYMLKSDIYTAVNGTFESKAPAASSSFDAVQPRHRTSISEVHHLPGRRPSQASQGTTTKKKHGRSATTVAAFPAKSTTSRRRRHSRAKSTSIAKVAQLINAMSTKHQTLLPAAKAAAKASGKPSNRGLGLGHLDRTKPIAISQVAADKNQESGERKAYPHVAISALAKVLSDRSMTQNHKTAIDAINKIFRILGPERREFLPLVVPTLINVIHVSDVKEVQATQFLELGKLVDIVKVDIFPYVPSIFQLVHNQWSTSWRGKGILLVKTMVETLPTAMLRPHILIVLKDFLSVLHQERDQLNFTDSINVLGLLSRLGAALDDHLYIVVPALASLVDSTMIEIQIRGPAIQTLTKIIDTCDNIQEYATLIMHALVHALEDCQVIRNPKSEKESTLNSKVAERLEPRTQLPRNGHAPAHGSPEDWTWVPSEQGMLDLIVTAFTAMVYRLEQDYSVYADLVDTPLRFATALHTMSNAAIFAGSSLESPLLQKLDAYYKHVDRVLRGQALVKQDSNKGAPLNCFVVDTSATTEGSGSASLNSSSINRDITDQPMDISMLTATWHTAQISTELEWAEWMRRFSLQLIKQSPSLSIQSCFPLAQVCEPLANELLNAAFLSCWDHMEQSSKSSLVAQLEIALKAPKIPKDLLQVLLNLAEHMEHDNKPLPIDIQILSDIAIKCQANAKALRLKEIQFRTMPEECIEALISINNDLEQQHAAAGVVLYARTHFSDTHEVKPQWYERLQHWDEALNAYKQRARQLVNSRKDSEYFDVHVGLLRCLARLGDWDAVLKIVPEKWNELSQAERLVLDIEDFSVVSPTSDDAATGYNSPSASSVPIIKTALPIGVLMRNRSHASSMVSYHTQDDEIHTNGLQSQPLSSAQEIAGQSLQLHASQGSATEPVDVELRDYYTSSNLAGRAGIQEESDTLDRTPHNDDFSLRDIVQTLATLGSYAAFSLNKWDDMQRFNNSLQDERYDTNFLKAIHALHDNQLDLAQAHIDKTYTILDKQLSPLVVESYSRAYPRLVEVMHMVELQEILEFKRTMRSENEDEARFHLSRLRRVWKIRLQGIQQTAGTLAQVLSYRTLIVDPIDDLDTWLTFATVSRKEGLLNMSLHALIRLGIGSVSSSSSIVSLREPDLGNAANTQVRNGIRVQPRVALAYCKYIWAVGDREEAVRRLKRLHIVLTRALGGLSPTTEPSTDPTSLESDPPGSKSRASSRFSGVLDLDQLEELRRDVNTESGNMTFNFAEAREDLDENISLDMEALNIDPRRTRMLKRLLVQTNCKLGAWELAMLDQISAGQPEAIKSGTAEEPNFRAITADLYAQRRRSKRLSITASIDNQKSTMSSPRSHQVPRLEPDQKLNNVLRYYKSATELDPNCYKAWHAWALVNVRAAENFEEGLHPCVVPAIAGLTKSISLGRRRGVDVLQDMLRLLSLWFAHFDNDTVERAMRDALSTLTVEAWLPVIPQLIARLNREGDLVCELLLRIGAAHPQKLLYPLTVASKSDDTARSSAAKYVMRDMSESFPELVDEALVVSRELIRVAILWDEKWHNRIEEAARHFFSANRNIEQMINVLKPLHVEMEDGPETMHEVACRQKYELDLQEASEWLHKYVNTQPADETFLHQAWDLYHGVFLQIKARLQKTKELELRYVSKVLESRNMQLAVPGTYRAGCPVTRIVTFQPNVRIIASKQRPRVVTMQGSDGNDHTFLLKGNEDLRMDERVMQLFGLLNGLLAQDVDTSKLGLNIQRYAVVPLSGNSGLVEWVPNCDTFNQLVKDYREKRNIPVLVEGRLMADMAPNYDNQTIMQRLEALEYALEQTSGRDLQKILWLKSPNSEVWLERRTTYTRSLATMSMVGYVLGLGDRHPSNIMIERSSAKVIMIDFGDCFEVCMSRDVFPETVPFRLTRMLINAMEATGIDGNYRHTCRTVMRLLRDDHEPILTILQAFVHDPLVSWRILAPNQPKHPETSAATAQEGAREDEKSEEGREDTPANSTNNKRAVEVIDRVRAKLTGHDFINRDDPALPVPVKQQVSNLIQQATSHERLARLWRGWNAAM